MFTWNKQHLADQEIEPTKQRLPTEKILWQDSASQLRNILYFLKLFVEALVLSALVLFLSPVLNGVLELYVSPIRQIKPIMASVPISVYWWIIAGFWLSTGYFIIRRYLDTRNRVWIATPILLKIRYGIFDTWVDEIQWSKYRDARIHLPFFLKPFGLGNIIIFSWDDNSPILVIEAIRNPRQVKAMMMDLIEKQMREHPEQQLRTLSSFDQNVKDFTDS